MNTTVLKIVKNTVEVLHSVIHDISVAAEWGWREDAFSRVLYASAKAMERETTSLRMEVAAVILLRISETTKGVGLL